MRPEYVVEVASSWFVLVYTVCPAREPNHPFFTHASSIDSIAYSLLQKNTINDLFLSSNPKQI